MKGAPLPMPRYTGLSPTQATKLSRAATDDFQGLVVLLRPLFRFLPLSEHTVADGFALIVCGPHMQRPHFEITDANDYPDLYAKVYERFAPALPPDDLEWAESEPLPVPTAVQDKIRLLKHS